MRTHLLSKCLTLGELIPDTRPLQDHRRRPCRKLHSPYLLHHWYVLRPQFRGHANDLNEDAPIELAVGTVFLYNLLGSFSFLPSPPDAPPIIFRLRDLVLFRSCSRRSAPPLESFCWQDHSGWVLLYIGCLHANLHFHAIQVRRTIS